MKEDFFDWLDSCPCQWFLTDESDESRSYKFIDNDEEEEN